MKADLRNIFNLDKIRISNKSFFCGDAAGRISPGVFKKKIYPSSTKGDFSDTDIKFALNIRLKFFTPEEVFLKDVSQIEFKLSGLNPGSFVEFKKEHIYEFKKEHIYEFKPRNKEIILMVGPQGSGKTEFVKKYILPFGYVNINQDICRTKKKCTAIMEHALQESKSIVIDNTNPSVASRRPYISLAQNYEYKHIRAIIMNTQDIIAKHLNNVRHIHSNGKIPKVNNIAYNIFKNNYVKPSKSEYFDKVETIDFIFDEKKMEDDVWKKIFLKWSEF
jgi:bifunctional polynucleotide phosphatase/kinase